eukprot:TRINITY_DN104574_c0_g1_i1.p1 TRINITY_DN104574_c0_g1~~TRINITY_DN104574_c0_g1_i1.p1  ORF type:complete len:525 (+),score=67.42 TRINITY_DN104574_c0_g1_i1:55-1575(+)
MAIPLRVASLLLFFSVVDAVASAENGCQSEDLKRAKQRVPRAAWKGSNFAGMAKLLSRHLSKGGHAIRPCAEWTVGELQQLQRRFFNESEPQLLSIYDAVVDNRRQRFKSLSALEAHWANIDAAAARVGGLDVVRRDGLCHETIMAAVHHISAKSLRRVLEDRQALPSLPVHRHQLHLDPTNLSSSIAKATQTVHDEYEHQVSCQQCHTGNIADPFWQDATLPKPVHHADKELERLERLRTCDYQAQPPCGPCEGLGGKRWGEGLHEFSPMPCTVIHGPEKPGTTIGRYPELGSASFTGETRSPLEIRPNPGEHVKYFKMNGNISVDYRGTVMFRQRYDFGEMGAEVSVQTYEQAKNMDPGATILAGGPTCGCKASIAGLFHRNCFDGSDPLDPLKLAPQEGGAAYLGRIKVKLDGDSQAASGEFIADHYMKWAFHFLVDANTNSSSFGLPLRLYGPMGVRQVFENWNLEDPAKARPNIWHLPGGCNVSAPACSLFPPARGEEIVV